MVCPKLLDFYDDVQPAFSFGFLYFVYNGKDKMMWQSR
jgi:hypothetical protein